MTYPRRTYGSDSRFSKLVARLDRDCNKHEEAGQSCWTNNRGEVVAIMSHGILTQLQKMPVKGKRKSDE